MRIPRHWVPSLAKRIIDTLTAKQLIETDVPLNRLVEETEKLITDELMVEDRLNEEVREILRKFETEIEKGRLDYRKLFDMTKQKLVREKNIIL